MLFKALLAAALALPAYYRDREPPEDRRLRLETIARAVDIASARAVCASEAECKPIWPGTRRELAFLLLTQAWYETRLASHIHRDECGPHECDAYRKHGKILHRSKSLWQLQASNLLPREVWETLGGTDLESTTRAAWYAAQLLARHRWRCARDTRHWVAPTVSGYARGGLCDWPPAAARARLWKKLISKY